MRTFAQRARLRARFALVLCAAFTICATIAASERWWSMWALSCLLFVVAAALMLACYRLARRYPDIPAYQAGNAGLSQQHIEYHHPGGWPRLHPYQGPRARLCEAWWVLTGRFTLHRAWQHGYDSHIIDESRRRARGGK